MKQALLIASSHVHIHTTLFLLLLNQRQQFVTQLGIRLGGSDGLVVKLKADAIIFYNALLLLLKLLLHLLCFFRVLQVSKLFTVLRFQLLQVDVRCGDGFLLFIRQFHIYRLRLHVLRCGGYSKQCQYNENAKSFGQKPHGVCWVDHKKSVGVAATHPPSLHPQLKHTPCQPARKQKTQSAPPGT